MRIRIPRFKRIQGIAGITIGILILSCTASLTMYVSADYAAFHYSVYGRILVVTPDERNAMTWLYHNTDSNSVILTSVESWEIAPIIGRSIVYSGYRPNMSLMIYLDTIRMLNSTDLTGVFPLFEKYNVTHVYITPADIEKYGNGFSKFENEEVFKLIYSSNGVLIYEFLD